MVSGRVRLARERLPTIHVGATKKSWKPRWFPALELRPGGFEPPTPGSEDRCSIQLSYGRVAHGTLSEAVSPIKRVLAQGGSCRFCFLVPTRSYSESRSTPAEIIGAEYRQTHIET